MFHIVCAVLIPPLPQVRGSEERRRHVLHEQRAAAAVHDPRRGRGHPRRALPRQGVAHAPAADGLRTPAGVTAAVLHTRQVGQRGGLFVETDSPGQC